MWNGPTIPLFSSSEMFTDDGHVISNLTLNITDESYEGMYYCIGSYPNCNASVISEPAFLVILVPPTILQMPTSIVVTAHHNVSLNCTATNIGSLNITWNQPEPSTESISIADSFKTNILLLTEVDVSSGGVYTCTASNEAGSMSAFIFLYITPVIEPNELLTNAGTNAILMCVIQQIPLGNITWLKLNNSGYFDIIMDETESVYNFTQVEYGDEGTYICQVNTLEYGLQESTDSLLSGIISYLYQSTYLQSLQFVHVIVSPDVIIALDSRNQTYIRNENATLRCMSMGGPNNIYRWQMDGKDIASKNFNNETLDLLNVNATNGGNYSCIVSNAAGSHSESTYLFIFPYFVTQPSNVMSTNGSEVSLICEVEAFPAPDYQWYRIDGMEIRAEIRSNILFINFVLFGDEGYYYCNATSQGNTIQSDVVLLSGKF